MDPLYRRFPLDAPKTIRLLVPQQHTPEGRLSYNFSVNSLESNTHYSALSYVWGSQKQSNPDYIEIDGVLCKVTPNLLSALGMVESAMAQAAHDTTTEQQPFIWADQLCINQVDNVEKSKQVTMMGELYEKAETVYVCLGISDTAQDAVRLVSEVSQRLDQDKEHYGGINYIPSPEESDVDWEWYNRFNWSALRTLLRQAWFTRVWVVQEAGLAKHAVALYSGYSFKWASLMLVLAWLSQAGYTLRRYHNIPGWTTHQLWVSFNHLGRDGLDNPKRYNFLDLISHAAYQFKATDPRDYIFAFLGHPSANQAVTDVGSSMIVPDYDATATSVFVLFARNWLEHSRQPHLLSCVNHKDLPEAQPGKVVDDFPLIGSPSWCPRWDHVPLGGSRLVDESAGHTYRAASSTQFEFQVLPGNCLELRGFDYDVVVDTIDSLKELPDLIDEYVMADPKFNFQDLANLVKLTFMGCRALDTLTRSSPGSNCNIQDTICSVVAAATASQPSDKDRLFTEFKGSVLEA